MVCPNCHTTNRLKAKFRDECGTGLSPHPTPRPEAERRQLTVLFCDVVGSTALAEQLDPEELRDVIRTYQELCAEVIGYYEGYIAQYLGDGLLVYFGHPFAQEDDAAQAVRAGLRIIQAVQDSPRFNQVNLGNHPVQVRIGIHTGQVVVGEMGGGGRHEIRGDLPAVHQTAEAAITLSQEQGFPHWLTMGRMLQGWASAMQRPAGDGLKQLKSGLAAWRATGSELLRSYFLSLLAAVQQQKGQVEEGLRTLDEALESVEEHGERFYEAELYRFKGELLFDTERSVLNAERKNQTTELSPVQHSAFVISAKPRNAFSGRLISHDDKAQSHWSCGRR